MVEHDMRPLLQGWLRCQVGQGDQLDNVNDRVTKASFALLRSCLTNAQWHKSVNRLCCAAGQQ